MAAGADIFISYAHSDAAELAARLSEDLPAAGFATWFDRNRLVGATSWTAEIENALDMCRVVLALISHGSYLSDVCRAEQLRALRKGKLVIPLLAATGSDIPLHLESKQYRDFTSSAPYAQQLERLISDLRQGEGAVVLQDSFRQTYVTAPPLPRNYVERPGVLMNLRSALIRDGEGASIALTALKGMGGIGKTVLAQALCHDEVIQQAFPDGIVWVTAGREPAYDLVTRMREVRRALHDAWAPSETELECINRYRNALREKAALVVIDDVWASHDVEPFRAESARSRILFTTRDASIAAAVGAEEFVADLLTEEQSRDVLARWAGMDHRAMPEEAGDLVRECGRLPLAVAMIGAMLRGKPRPYWKHVHNLLRSAQLGKIASDFPNYVHKDLLRAMQVSVDELDSTARARYFALAVALENMPIRPAIQQVLWNAEELDALDTAERLIGLSLAQRNAQDGGILLHDLQLDYVRTQFPDKDVLQLIHGALRLSSRAIEEDPRQFASQMWGRLLPHSATPGIEQFIRALRTGARGPWLRLLNVTLHPPGTGLLRTLEGHSASVNHVTITADGLRALSGSWDNSVKVWDLESGRELQTLNGHSASVSCVAATPDGRHAVSASEDDTLKIWDLESGREVRTVVGHWGSVKGVAITPDGRYIVSASWDKTLRIWELSSGRELRTLKGHQAPVTSVIIVADGRWAVSTSEDDSVRVWDLESGSELQRFTGHSDVVFHVAACPRQPWLISASRDKTLKVWDLKSGGEIRTLHGHSDFVYGVAVTSDGRHALSASRDRTLKVWDMESGRVVQTLTGHSASVTSVAAIGGGRTAASASWDRTLRIWDLESVSEVHPLAGHSRFVSGVAASADGARGLSACWDSTLKVWDLESGIELRTLTGHESSVEGVAITPDGRLAVSASRDTTLKLWNVESGEQLCILPGHSDTVSGVAITLDGRLAVSASRDGTLKLWDLSGGCELRTLTGHTDGVTAVAISREGQLAVSASVDQTLKVWDLASGREVSTLLGHTQTVSAVALSPEGSLAVSASWDKTLKVWDLNSGCNVRTLAAHSDRISGVAFTSDGRNVLSASVDKSVVLWDLHSGMRLAAFTFDAPVYCCATAAARILAGDQAGRVHVLAIEGSGTTRRNDTAISSN
jgi:WD40 repeat protein